MKLRQHKKTALVTGASSGIGEECAKWLARRGFDLVVVARSEDRLQALQRTLERRHRIRVTVAAKDLAQPDAPKELFRSLQAQGIAVDVLVNNAGFGDYAAFLDASWDKQEDMVNLNILALMQMTYLFGGEMRKRGRGCILNLASVAGFSAGPFMSVYYATKAFVLSFSQSVAEELKGTGVTVTALCPGPTATHFPQAANMRFANMFKIFKNAASADVAAAGCSAAMQGKPVRNHSVLAHAFNFGAHVLPKRVTCVIAKQINGVPPEQKQGL